MAQKILIIDDDIDLVEATKNVLEGIYSVNVANSGTEGWKKLEEDIPDLIILDVMMENRAEGFIFSRKMRKIEKYSRIPILMLTGMREQTGFAPIKEDPRHPKFLPVDEFMEKPVKPAELLDRIEKMLNK